MTNYLELEIGLQRLDDAYHADLRLSDALADLVRTRGEVSFDLPALLALTGNWEEYGRLLGKSLLGNPSIGSGFANAETVSRAFDRPLRFRLAIDESAAELHPLNWEVLRHPQTGELLATVERLLFYRYVSTPDWRLVEHRSRNTLRALVVIANPVDIATYAPGGRALPALDVAAEEKRAIAALGNKIPATVLASGGTASLNGITSKLREGYDILYLLCHGALIDEEPRLYLETDEGTTDVVSGHTLVTYLNELTRRPRLVVFASCQSAGVSHAAAGNHGEAGIALAPRMAAAGVPAVLGMQGNISIATASAFMTVFFRELERDGSIDRAVSAARGSVRQREEDDWWMPVLYMSLKHGSISWYPPGFAGEEPGFDCWEPLLNHINEGRCTPILGQGLLESMVGSLREMAHQWANEFGYPMAGDEREDLPLVAQFVTVIKKEETFVRDCFAKAIRGGILRHYGHDLDASASDPNKPLNTLISAAGRIRRKLENAEPHEVLAGLDRLPLYITANPDNLLQDALTDAERLPHTAHCPRGDYGNGRDLPPGYEPSPEQPLVYHLFGSLNDRSSLVLTQDDYFDYLIDVTRNNDRIPKVVRSSLVNSSLLFLGFHMTDWKFRVLLRFIMNQEGGGRRRRFSHVAVQLDPSYQKLLDPEKAREYLARYFDATNISIYWGSAEDFLAELKERMEAQALAPL